jgi:hypothetical protein
MELCTPAILYLGLSGLGLIVTASTIPNPVVFFVHVLFIAIWTGILQTLCSVGLSIISWILVFLPLIIIAIILVLFAGAEIIAKQHN